MHSHDHETSALDSFHELRLAIIRLAHQQTPVLTTTHLLEAILYDEALEVLRVRWRDAPDPRDLPEPANWRRRTSVRDVLE